MKFCVILVSTGRSDRQNEHKISFREMVQDGYVGGRMFRRLPAVRMHSLRCDVTRVAWAISETDETTYDDNVDYVSGLCSRYVLERRAVLQRWRDICDMLQRLRLRTAVSTRHQDWRLPFLPGWLLLRLHGLVQRQPGRLWIRSFQLCFLQQLRWQGKLAGRLPGQHQGPLFALSTVDNLLLSIDRWRTHRWSVCPLSILF